MQSVFTFAIEAFTISCFAFFATVFVGGFAQYERDRHICSANSGTMVPTLDLDIEAELAQMDVHHRPIIEDAVVPFQRPYRKPEIVAIDWSKWDIRDLKKARLRKAFGIPATRHGKSLTKPQFIELYEAALEDSDAIAA